MIHTIICKTVFKDVLTKEPGCLKVPIREVYSATNNLCESNVIGEGTAGKNFDKHNESVNFLKNATWKSVIEKRLISRISLSYHVFEPSTSFIIVLLTDFVFVINIRKSL